MSSKKKTPHATDSSSSNQYSVLKPDDAAPEVPAKPPDQTAMFQRFLEKLDGKLEGIESRLSSIESRDDTKQSFSHKAGKSGRSKVYIDSDEEQDDSRASCKLSPSKTGFGKGNGKATKSVPENVDVNFADKTPRTTQLVTAVEPFQCKMENLYVNTVVEFINSYHEYCLKNVEDGAIISTALTPIN